MGSELVYDQELYALFIKLTEKLSNSFQTEKDALMQRNAVVKWNEFITLQDSFKDKLRDSRKEIPDDESLKPILFELGSRCIGKDDAGCIKEYEELERCMIEPSDGPRVWCYVHQLDCPIDIIDLDGPLRIRKATIVERALLKQKWHSTGLSPTFIAETKRGTVETILDKEKAKRAGVDFHIELFTMPPFGDAFFTLVSILRLTIPSPVGYDELVYQDEAGELSTRMVYQVSPWKHPCSLGVLGQKKCELNGEDVRILNVLWDGYNKASQNFGTERFSRLQRAIRRYERAICSNEVEDAIVDLIIALEILFEVGGREMAKLASHLIGSNEKSRGKLFRLLDDARKMRNSIVHGGFFDSNNDLVDRYLLSIVRRIIVCSILLAKEKEWFAGLVRDAVNNASRLEELHDSISEWLIK
jgi:hypothetical protein